MRVFRKNICLNDICSKSFTRKDIYPLKFARTKFTLADTYSNIEKIKKKSLNTFYFLKHLSENTNHNQIYLCKY